MAGQSGVGRLGAVVNGGAYSAETVEIGMRVDNFPSATCGIAPAGDTVVVAPVAEDSMARMASLQSTRLSGRSSPDLTVEVFVDGVEGGSMRFDGYISAPLLSASKFNVADQISGVGAAAFLDALDMSIYNVGYPALRAESGDTAGGNLPPMPGATDGDLPKLLLALTEALTGSFDKMLAAESSENARQLMAQQHSINEGAPSLIWKGMLEGSDATFESWKAAVTKSPYLGKFITSRCKDMLISQSPGFWNKVRSMMASFQMMYIPSLTGSGRLVRADAKVGAEEGELGLSARSFTLVDGSPSILQPGGVVMSAAGSGRFLRQESAQITPRLVAFHPPQIQAGYIHREPYPSWLLGPDGMPIPLPTELADEGGPQLDLARYAAAVRDTKAYVADLSESLSGILTELCEVSFLNLQLAHATATVTTSLDFTVNDSVGKRMSVKVRSPRGGGSFTAFVDGVDHTINLTDGKTLDSHTRIKFTHVKF